MYVHQLHLEELRIRKRVAGLENFCDSVQSHVKDGCVEFPGGRRAAAVAAAGCPGVRLEASSLPDGCRGGDVRIFCSDRAAMLFCGR